MDVRMWVTCQHSSLSATCSLYCIHSQPLQSLVIHTESHSRHQGPNAPTQECHSSMFHPCTDWPSTQLQARAPSRRHGGLGLINQVTTSSCTFQASKCLTTPLATLIVAQEPDQEVNPHDVETTKKTVRNTTDKDKTSKPAMFMTSSAPNEVFNTKVDKW